MCGIAGILKTERDDGITADLLVKISQKLQHRGPDDAGFLGWTPLRNALATREPSKIDGARVAFVHRRLSIIDLSDAGWQPMQSEDRLFSIVFNGEIYNYIELRRELEKHGYRFCSDSDTEVLLTSYIHWGVQCLTKLTGMFAFAILDLRRESLFLARDFFGIKPLYYYHSKNVFGFASEVNVLLEFPEVSRHVNIDRLFPYLRFGVTDYGEETLWLDIHQVPAAHYMEVPLDKLTLPSPIRYWKVPDYIPQSIGYDEATEYLRNLFLDSVRLHLRSDVPVGTCLSGGMDSSAIVTAMRDLLGEHGDIHTFSHLASDEKLNEEPWIDIVVQSAKAKSYRIRPSENDLLLSIEDLIQSQGEPFRSTSIFAQYKVFELASRQKIKVILDGQGADEMLAGYPTFLGMRIASLLAQSHFYLALQLYIRSCKFPDISCIGLAAITSGVFVPDWMRKHGRSLIGRDLIPSWMNQSWFKRHGLQFIIPWEYQSPYYLQSHLIESLETVSLPMLLRFEDRNSMRFSIESRVPFLIPQIAEFLLSLPEEYIIDQQGLRKSILRKALRGLVPDAILDRKDKIGFAAPENKWIQSLAPWVEKLLNSEAAHTIPALKLPEVKKIWQGIRSGQIKDKSSSTWRWINLIEWTRIFNAEYDV